MSPRLKTRREQKAATRENLLEAARRCFAERGFRATNVAHISRAAGVAHGTFYVHFDSKEQLLDQLLDQLNQSMAMALVAAVPADAPVADAVRAAARCIVELLAEQRDFVQCYLERSASGLVPEAFREGINPPVARFVRQALQHWIGDRADSARVDLVAHGLLAMWLRIILQHLFDDQVDRETAIDTLTRLTVGALGAAFPPAAQD